MMRRQFNVLIVPTLALAIRYYGNARSRSSCAPHEVIYELG